MFWSDRGTSPHISSANMDGTEREPIISTHIVSPNGLAIDFNGNICIFFNLIRMQNMRNN